MDRLPEELLDSIYNMNLFAPGVPADHATLQAVLDHVVRGAKMERTELIETEDRADDRFSELWDGAGELSMQVRDWKITLTTTSSTKGMDEDGDIDMNPTVLYLDVSIIHETAGVGCNVGKAVKLSRMMQRQYAPTVEGFDALVRDTRRLLEDIKTRGPCRCSCTVKEKYEPLQDSTGFIHFSSKLVVCGPLPHPKLPNCEFCGKGMCAGFFGDTTWKPVVEATTEGSEA